MPARIALPATEEGRIIRSTKSVTREQQKKPERPQGTGSGAEGGSAGAEKRHAARARRAARLADEKARSGGDAGQAPAHQPLRAREWRRHHGVRGRGGRRRHRREPPARPPHRHARIEDQLLPGGGAPRVAGRVGTAPHRPHHHGVANDDPQCGPWRGGDRHPDPDRNPRKVRVLATHHPSSKYMKSYYIKSFNGKTVFEPREVPVPQPKAGEILVKVRAASLNRGEILASISLHSAEVPHPAGGDCAGEVHAVGEGVTAFKPGDRVLGRARGSFSEFVAMSVQQAALVPQRLTWEQAATVPISAITAYEAILGYGKLKSGETLLVVGAASGVGVV